MKTRYKVGRFTAPVTVLPGDKLNLVLKEYDAFGNETKQTISEDINVTMTVTHWVMFYIKGVGFGGLFGGPDVGSQMPEIFVDPERVNDEDRLIG